MPPNMEFLGKLRITRLYLMDLMDKEPDQFNRECLEVALKVIGKEIVLAEFKRYEEGKTS